MNALSKIRLSLICPRALAISLVAFFSATASRGEELVQIDYDCFQRQTKEILEARCRKTFVPGFAREAPRCAEKASEYIMDPSVQTLGDIDYGIPLSVFAKCKVAAPSIPSLAPYVTRAELQGAIKALVETGHFSLLPPK